MTRYLNMGGFKINETHQNCLFFFVVFNTNNKLLDKNCIAFP